MPVAICLLLLAPLIHPAQKSSAPKDARSLRARRHFYLACDGTTNRGSRRERVMMPAMVNSEPKSGAWITWTILFASIACAALCSTRFRSREDGRAMNSMPAMSLCSLLGETKAT